MGIALKNSVLVLLPLHAWLGQASGHLLILTTRMTYQIILFPLIFILTSDLRIQPLTWHLGHPVDISHSICPKLNLFLLYEAASSSSTSSLCWLVAPPPSQSPTLDIKVTTLTLHNYSKINSCSLGFTDISQIYPVLSTLAQASIIPQLAIAAISYWPSCL